MAQAKIKQIKGLVSALDAIAGIDNIVESFTTTARTARHDSRASWVG